METIGRRLEKGTFLVGNQVPCRYWAFSNFFEQLQFSLTNLLIYFKTILQLTWADVAVAEMLTRFEQCYDSNALRDWPKIKQFCLNIERHPQLKLWIENRPRSVFWNQHGWSFEIYKFWNSNQTYISERIYFWSTWLHKLKMASFKWNRCI